jgi:hypothetical protein
VCHSAVRCQHCGQHNVVSCLVVDTIGVDLSDQREACLHNLPTHIHAALLLQGCTAARLCAFDDW